jgi:8-oxo-dGTP diphosphatase
MMKKLPIKDYEKYDLKRGVDFIGITTVFFCHDGKGNFVMHKRSNKCRDEIGKWDFGGGAMEFGETFEEAVSREILEEYCTDIMDLKFLGAKNLLRRNGNQNTHWIVLVFAALVDPKKVKIGDPEKMEELGWFTEDDFPSPPHSGLKLVFDVVKDAGII